LPIHQSDNADAKKALRQFLQYVLVGGTSFAVDFSTLYLLTEQAGLHYLISATIAFLLGLVTNYLLCITWIFDVHVMNNRLHEFTVFGCIGIAGLMLNNVLLYALTDWLGLFYLVSKTISAGIILIFNFSLRRRILFSGRCTASESPTNIS
jgi:putative flippase GtrA